MYVEVVLLDQRGKNGKCRRYGITRAWDRASRLSCFLTRFIPFLPLMMMMIDRGKTRWRHMGSEQLVKCK